jgi:hypothetical protein
MPMNHAYWALPSFVLCVACGSSGGSGQADAPHGSSSNDAGAAAGPGSSDSGSEEGHVADAQPTDAPDAGHKGEGGVGGGDAGVIVVDAGPWAPSDAGPISTTASWEDVSLPTVVTGQAGVSALALVPGTNTVMATSGMTSFWGPVALFTSDDDGTNWSTANATSLTNLPFWITFAPNPSTFLISGELSKTTNNGSSFTLVSGPAAATQNGSAIASEQVAIGPDGLTMVTGIHERRLVFRSKNGGQSWDEIDGALPSGIAFPAYPLVLDANTYLIGCSFAWDGSWDTGNGTPGVFRTTNGGTSWTQVSSNAAVNAPTVTSSRIFWSFQGSNNGGIVTSDNLGVTWNMATPDSLNPWVTPIVLPDNRIATLDSAGHVVTSADGSPPWTPVGPTNQHPNLRVLIYEPVGKTFFAFSWNTFSGSIQRLKVQ